MCGAKAHVRFTPNSDRKSRHPQNVMSALPPKADMCSARNHVCFGPKADMVTSLDQIICAGNQRKGYADAEFLGSFKINYQFVLGWCLHRKIGWLLSLEDAIDVAGRLPQSPLEIGSVRDQATAITEFAYIVHRRQAMACRQPNNAVAINQCEGAGCHGQPIVRSAYKSRDSAFYFVRVLHVDWM